MAQKIALPTREEMDQEYCWKLEDIFETDELWMDSCTELEKGIEEFRELKGELSRGPEQMYQVLCKSDELQKRLESIYVYANQKYHQDTGCLLYTSRCV